MNTKYTSKSITLFAAIILSLTSFITSAQVTGLSNYKIFLDPGHSGQENLGLYTYSEAEKTLRVGLALKELFETQTDIEAVHICRTSDNDQISLTARTDLANSLGVDFYYSIHSDAGSPGTNSTLTMYGGWQKNDSTIEKSPAGGKAFGEILNIDLSGTMRIDNRGNYADRNYYYPGENTHDNQWPYLHVNRESNMASLLSEAGFHTNPMQQQRNLNAEWKKLEALSAFRSFLKYKNLECPPVGVATGIITDDETGLAINGLTVTIGEKTYVTDSYQSLFKKYSNDPEKLRNGFYWIEGLTPGEEVEVVFSSDSYETKTVNLTVANNPEGSTLESLSLLDVELTSSVPPIIKTAKSEDGLTAIVPGNPIVLTFSRTMDTASVEAASSINPEKELLFNWLDDFTLEIGTTNLEFETAYTISIDGSIAKNKATGQFIDGNGDGTVGDNYELLINTADTDITPPALVDYSPTEDEFPGEIRPIVRMVFDESLSDSSITLEAVKVVAQTTKHEVPGTITHHVTDKESVLHFFPLEDLTNNEKYDVNIQPGLKDLFGNATDLITFSFTVHEQKITKLTSIDNFNGPLAEWWQPQASETTKGIITEVISWEHDSENVVFSAGSTGSAKMNYGWDTGNPYPYIREYLPPDAPQNSNGFNISDVLQMYVFGDGSGNQFRFMLRDGDGKYEASRWFTFNWKGWKLISLDLAKEYVYGWVNGNGVLDGIGFTLDGIHLRYKSKATEIGAVYFDELQFVERNAYVTGVNDLTIKENNVQVFPNPASEKITVRSSSEIKRISIYNYAGQVVLNERVNQQEKSIKIKSFQKGLYVIKVTTAAGEFTSKLSVL